LLLHRLLLLHSDLLVALDDAVDVADFEDLCYLAEALTLVPEGCL
jgi:hypothetical protein